MAKGAKTAIKLSEWTCRQADSEAKWISATVPSNIHLELMKANMIPDPFIDLNEELVQWVGEVDWEYKTDFNGPEAAPRSKIVLAFDGLDTFATIKLNGKEMMRTDNMFTPYRLDITNVVTKKNELSIIFESALRKGKEIEEKKGRFKSIVGDTSRRYVRKAQYHYGWDWGPTLMTCGPWRDVRLEIYEARIEDLHVVTTLNKDLSQGTVKVVSSVEGPAKHLRIQLLDPTGKALSNTTAQVQAGASSAQFEISTPDLWWPATHGKQPLYLIQAELVAENGTVLDKASRKFGIRSSEIIQKPLDGEPGTSFYFRINNVPIFAGGSNWIPADSFLPRLTTSSYRAWLQLLVEGGQNMIRVWGGGIYEDDAFYDLCDELGIMVWQDFMFACALYPKDPEFLRSVELEARENVKRLRNHPSIMLYAGNNEDYWIAEGIFKEIDWKKEFPYDLYEKVLPSVVEELSSHVHYHRSSPYGGEDPNDTTVGDCHQWHVWHLEQFPYQKYPELKARFVSEFGMESFPNIRTVDSYISNKVARHTRSRVVEAHNKCGGAGRRLDAYVGENFRFESDLESWVYVTQLLQAESVGAAYRGWRREWRGEGKEYCGGVLVWQLNDCWQVTSWAIADYFLSPKPAYYVIKRELAPVAVGIERVAESTKEAEWTSQSTLNRTVQFKIWDTNSGLEERKLSLSLHGWDIPTGKAVDLVQDGRSVVLKANQSTEVCEFTYPSDGGNLVVEARLTDDHEETIAHYSSWPDPLKYADVAADPKLHIESKGDTIHLKTDKPMKGLWLHLDDDKVKFDDNFLDLMPGDSRVVKAKGLNGRKVEARWYH